MCWRNLLGLALVAAVGCGESGGTTPGDAATVVDAAAPDVLPEVEVDDGPGCAYEGRYLLAGPCEDDFDAELDAKARRYDRCWRTFNAAAQGLNTDIDVAVENEEDRALVEAFVQEHDGWDFEAFAGKPALDVITQHHKVAGLYAGVGIAADAFRYGVLRDQGYPEAEVDIAREHLLIGVEGFHRAATLPGQPGIIARGTARQDLTPTETFPLFDEDGLWVPLEKNNGTWREDQSGQYPGWAFEDSISRDQMLGWVTAAAAAWEVMRHDPAFGADVKAQLQADALAIGSELMIVRPNGWDLEIWDAEGRRTLHGCLHEHNLDCVLYSDGFDNGFHAVMALGAVAAWAFVSEDPTLAAYLHDELLGERKLAQIVRDKVRDLVWAGNLSNYSNYNMAFGSMWLALRYIDDPEAVALLQEGLHAGMYAIEDEPNQPVVLKQSLFDFIYAAGMAGTSVGAPLATSPDTSAVARGVETLHEMGEPPHWNWPVENCPGQTCTCEETQVPEPQCVSVIDGETTFDILGCVGRNCDLIAAGPTPMRLRPKSNYYWRSNPRRFNGPGHGGLMLPGVDFRFAYWLGRFVVVE